MPIGMYKIKSSDIPAFLDITPSEQTNSWKLIGNFQSDGDRSYEASENEEQYINDDGPTTEVEGYKVSLENEMKCVKGDDVFDYVDGLRYALATGSDAQSNVLLIDKYSYTEDNSTVSYRAQKWNCSISISKQGRSGKGSTLGYKVNLNGTPINGTVTISAGVPTFTATVS